jgi:hypothetical protein
MTCATCKHARTPDDPRMRDWINCALDREPWHYLIPECVCHHNPSRWEIKL